MDGLARQSERSPALIAGCPAVMRFADEPRDDASEFPHGVVDLAGGPEEILRAMDGPPIAWHVNSLRLITVESRAIHTPTPSAG